MAKEKIINTKLTYSISFQDIDREIKKMEKLATYEGKVGEQAKSVIAAFKGIKDILNKFGDEIPTQELKNMEKILRGVGKTLNILSTADPFNASNKSVEELNVQLKEAERNLSKLKGALTRATKAEAAAKLAAEQAAVPKNRNIRAKEKIKLASPELQASISNVQKNFYSALENRSNIKEGMTEEQVKVAEESLRIITELRQEKEKSIEATEKLKKATDKLTQASKNYNEQEKLKEDLEVRKQKAFNQDHADNLAKTKEFVNVKEKELSVVTLSAQASGAATVKVETGVEKLSGTFQNATSKVIKFSIVYQALKRILKESIRTIREMDESITGMMVVTGKTREEVENYIGAIKDVSAATSTAMTDVANLVTEYVRQGRTMRDALLLAEETAKAAKIAGISTRDSLVYMTSAINGFNLAVSDATRVSDIFANLAAVSATDYEQLAVALSKVSAQANMAGLSIEYTTALLAKGIEVTQEAPESIGTALKTVIARMRELTDYGKTLEDGMGVNRVESALKAAGIELRTLNGEFRDLEDVFNELGPQWDSLNNNQRQAIAQAVAGTRQQSRFVAIMQDWTRTQELATEAQDSAGASAAQYAQYSTGIEAAITRMTTAWQGFIQSLTSSKVIIFIVNTVAKTINGVTAVLESFGGITKPLFILLTAVMAVNSIFSKMHSIMAAFGEKGVGKEREMLILAQQRRVETEQMLALQLESLELKRKALEEELTDPKIKLSKEDKDAKEAEHLAVEQAITNTQLARATISSEIEAHGEKYKTALDESVSSNLALNNEYIRRLKLQKESIQAEIKLAGEQKNQTNDDKEKERIQKRINNLLVVQEGIEKKITKVNERSDKLKKGTLNTVQKMGSLLATKISMAFDSIFSKLGPIGDMLSGLVMTTIQWGMGLISSLFTKKQIGNEDKKNLAINVTGTAVDAAKVGLTKAEGKAEEEVTEEKVKQAGQERKGFLASLKGLLFKKLGLGLTKKQTQATQKEAAASVQDAGADSASSAAKIPYVGWAIALGILAMFGLVAGLGALSSGAADEALAKSKQQKTETELGEKQTTLYEKKKENRDLQKDQERYNELANKSVRTEEEKTEMGELIESMRQVDESWKNMTDSTLLKEVSKKIGENTSQINSLIDSNYETALKMRNLDKSVVGQQAITAKLIREQDRLIRTNEKLITLNDPQVTEKVEAVVTSGLEDIVAKTDYSKLEKLQEEDVRWDDYLKNIAIGAVVEGAAGSVVPIVGNIAGLISGAITGLAYTISEDIDNERKQEKEQRNLETLWRDASVKLVDVATTMEIERSQENTSIARQTAAYNKALEDNKIDPNVDSLAKSVIDTQYSTVSFIATLTKGNDQVLDNIEKLTSAGRVTEESILQMAKVFADLQNTDFSYKKAEVLIEKASKLDLGKHDDLSDLALEYLGKSTNFTMQELRDAMMATVKKGDEDAPKKDFRDNYKERGGHGVNNAEFTRAIEHIDKIISLVGGNLTEESIKKLAGTMSGANAGDMFTQLMNTLGEATLEGEPTIEAQQKSWEEAYTEGRTKVDEFIQNREEIAAKLQESADIDYENYKKAQEDGNEDEATKYLKSATTAREQAALFLTQAKTLDTQVSEGFRLMRGDLTTTELKDMVAAYTSEKKKINELKEALINETELSDEQYDKIEDVMAFMQDKDPTFDTLEFMKQVQEGSIEAINILNEYGNDLIEKNLKKMESNVWTKQNALDEIEAKLKIEKDPEERKRLEAQRKAAERNLARAKIEMENVEKGLQKLDAKAQREQKLSDLQRQLDIANEKSITETYDKRLLLMDEMEKIYKDLLEEEYERAAKQNGYTKEQLKDYVAALKSTDKIADNMEIISNFTADQVKDFNRSLEAVLDLENNLDDIAENRKADTTAWYEEQIDYQNQIIDAYKSQLEKEKDLLQESLDKRKTLYQKYFDFLDQEDEETDFESEQKRLQDTIAKLSTASDAGSLARLKEAQEELADLEKDRLKTERQQRRDAINVGIEAKSKAIDDEFERITSNAQGMWETVSKMPGEQIESLMTTYNDEFQNATDLNKEYLLLSYAELWANVKRMAGDEDAAKRLDQRAEAIRNLQIARSSGDAAAIAAAEEALNAIPYEDGGKVTHTGLAMVHGTPSKPEAFLNATQTMLLSNLGANLQNMAIMIRSGGAISTDANHSALSIEDFTINISANMTNDQNIQRTGETLAEIFFERIQAGGIPVNRKR